MHTLRRKRKSASYSRSTADHVAMLQTKLACLQALLDTYYLTGTGEKEYLAHLRQKIGVIKSNLRCHGEPA